MSRIGQGMGRFVMSLAIATSLMTFAGFGAGTVMAHSFSPTYLSYDCLHSPSEANCDGVDPSYVWQPENQSCAATGTTMWTQNWTEYGRTYQVQMRYSTNCHSRWARISFSGGGCGTFTLSAGRTVTDTGTTEWQGYGVNGACDYSGAYTDMIYAPADTSNNTWQVNVEAYDNGCGGHGAAVYWPSANYELDC